MEPKVPATYPYPEPDQSSTCPPHSTSWRCILISSSNLCLGLLFLRFPQPKHCIHFSFPHMRYMPRPSHSSRCDHPNNIVEGHISLSFSLCRFAQSPVTSTLLCPISLFSILFSNTLSLRSSLNVSNQVSHPYKTIGKIVVHYILIFICLDSKLKDRKFCTIWQPVFPEFSLILISSHIKFYPFGLFPNIWTLPPFRRNYNQSLHYDFVLHSDLETWPCT